MTQIPIPSAKLNVVFKAGALPQIDPAAPAFTLDLGGVTIEGQINAKSARKLATHGGGAVLQGKLVAEQGRLKLLDAGFQWLEAKPAGTEQEGGWV